MCRGLTAVITLSWNYDGGKMRQIQATGISRDLEMHKTQAHPRGTMRCKSNLNVRLLLSQDWQTPADLERREVISSSPRWTVLRGILHTATLLGKAAMIGHTEWLVAATTSWLHGYLQHLHRQVFTWFARVHVGDDSATCEPHVDLAQKAWPDPAQARLCIMEV